MNPEDNKNFVDLTKPKNTVFNSFSSAIFYLSILFFIIGFNFSDTMVGNWQQQFMPDLGGRNIVDITFADSLNGYAVTSRISNTSYILKTSNGGNNWSVIYIDTNLFTCIQFLNQNTGYVGGLIQANFNYHILKTTNGGINWTNVNTPFDTYQDDIHALNEDTIWFAMSSSFNGGVFRTTNGGVNWQQQFSVVNQNPDRIYMYNARIGFVSKTGSLNLRKTTDGGQNWNLVSGTGTGSFNDIYFIDSLTGWKAKTVGGGGWLFGKTSDGGFNWQEQILPFGGNISSGSGIVSFDNVNKDTIWGAGGNMFYTGQGARAFLYRTTNGGNTWYLQIPDTSYQIPTLSFVDFVDKLNGWSYMSVLRGIHTTTGGDTNFILPVTTISENLPKQFSLFQNYPNPFNPVTKIRYDVKRQTSNVKLIVYDITGKLITELTDQKQNPGTYEVEWNASLYSSGVYFYSLIAEGIVIDTRKMILIK